MKFDLYFTVPCLIGIKAMRAEIEYFLWHSCIKNQQHEKPHVGQHLQYGNAEIFAIPSAVFWWWCCVCGVVCVCVCVCVWGGGGGGMFGDIWDERY